MPEFDDNLVGERKNITVLFADIVDSTLRVDRLDAEEAGQLLGSVVGRLARIVEQYGGATIHRLGDGLVAVFGAPVATESHAVSACHAALAMQALMRAFAGNAPAGQVPVQIRIGINTGEAVVQPHPLDVFGIMVHIASRLQSIAQPGSIWISKATMSAIGSALECRPIGLKAVKGVQKPIDVYALENARGVDRPRFGLEHWDIDLRFVGRKREMETIRSTLARLADGHGAILAIWGDAGIGKSRLLAEAKTRAGHSLLWLEGPGMSLGRSISYLPLLQIIRRYIGAREDETSAGLWDKLTAALRALFGAETDDVLPYIATFLGLEVTAELKERVIYLDGEGMGRQVRRSLRLFFQEIARKRPTILVLEDFYWADESTATLLEHLLPLAETEALVFCIIGRGEAGSLDARLRAHAKQNHAVSYVEVPVTALRPEEGMELFDRLFAGEPRLNRLREVILHNAEGNPLFIEEVVRTLLETGALIHDPHDRRWTLTADPDAIRIPGTIQDVVTARVDRLPEHVKYVLTAAAVIGKSFLYKVLSAVTEKTGELDDDLASLLAQEFIGERSRAPELEYVFRHAVIQEVTYDCILKARRRQIHRQVGETLEKLFSGNLDDLSGVLAYHFGRAEIWEKAQEYLFKAGDRADRLSADAEALYSYRQAVEACMLTFGNRMEPLQRAAIDRKLGEAYYRRGEHEEAFRHFDRALACVGGRTVRRLGAAKGALLRESLVQAAHLIGLFRRSRQPPDAAAEIRIAIYQMMAWMFLFNDPEQLVLCVLILLNDAERCGHATGTAYGAAYLAYGCDMSGLPGLALRYNQKAARAAVICKNPVTDCIVELARSWHLTYAGRWDEARESFAAAAKLGWGCGDSRAYESSIFGQSIICCQQGRFEQAWELAQKQCELGEETADQVAMRSGSLLKGMILLRLGRMDKSEAILRESLAMAEKARDFLMMPLLMSELGHCLVRQQRLADADAALAAAADIVRTGGQQGYGVVLLKAAIAEAHVAKAEQASGFERARYLGPARQSCRQALRATKIYCGARLPVLRLMGICAWLGGDEKGAYRHWQKAQAAAEALGAKYELAQINLTIGRLSRSPAKLEQANAMLDTLVLKVLPE